MFKIHGIDFTSAPSSKSPKKYLTCARCSLVENKLQIKDQDEDIVKWETFEKFEKFLRMPGPWIAAIDFPFGQPQRFVERIGWPSDWKGYVKYISLMTREKFVSIMREDQGKYIEAEGQQQLRRETDKLSASCSPMKLDYPPVAKMFYEGSKRLINSPCFIWPFDNAEKGKLGKSDGRIVVEGYPALVARFIIGNNGYKIGKNGYKAEIKQKEKERDNRAVIISGLQSDRFVSVYGFVVDLRKNISEMCINDETGDMLDALLCAVQATWFLKNSHRIHQLSDDIMREGCIVDPKTGSLFLS